RRAAIAIDAYLRGRPVLEKIPDPVRGAPLAEKIFPVRLEKLAVAGLPTMAPEYAVGCFDEVEAAMDPGEAREDARRCMKCGYVDVRHELCIGCGTCARVCPRGDVIRLESPRPQGALEQDTEVRS
ncbi:MAG TPA: 4Fe-4S binding protein, partial [Deltaproteobacteria bacterium]|nr:4Fe-4S binding protein [Deltaproteobacteria bacterium]